jgi:gamma-glutamylcyclotransferase (GGCT)/AIG2-like uncharacterized protein YtfP
MIHGDPIPLFVYGTLIPGESNYPRYLAGRDERTLPATLDGAVLYTHGPFPYLVRAAELVQPGDYVAGVLVWITPADYAQTLAAIDRLEGYSEGGSDNHYERIPCTVETEEGSYTAWAYEAGELVQHAILSGDPSLVPLGTPSWITYSTS